MKANELMIGDWVNYHDSWAEPNNKPIQITDIYGEMCNCTIWYGYEIQGGSKLRDCTPIRITDEILEKNGFVKHDKIHPYYMDYYHERDGFTIFNGCSWHGYILGSVHELQHALRLCELNDLADNFKV